MIAHHVSMIVVQAGAERRVLDPAQESTREVLGTIEQRRPQRPDRDAAAGRHAARRPATTRCSPSPRSPTSPPWSHSSATPGLPVELLVEGERRELPVGIELSAYRVVQEGLTNALKHAGAAHCPGPDRLRARARWSWRSPTTARARPPGCPGGGHGLAGIQERVALYGGELEAGPRADGGFVLRVLLPTG